jgi:hypothetical protein
MKQIILLIAFLLPACVFAQFSESFSGAELTSENPWEGDLNLFKLNDSGQLQFTSPQGMAGSASIGVPVDYHPAMTWETEVRLDFKSTNANNLRIHVYASGRDSFYIQAGNNGQQISFYEKNGGSSPKPQISGRKSLPEEPYTFVTIRLTLENDQLWTLYTRKAGETAYYKEGIYKMPPAANEAEALMRLTCRYIKGRISEYFFDNIRVSHTVSDLPEPPPPEEPEPEPGTEPEPDPEQPSSLELLGVELLNEYEIQFIFDKPIDISNAWCTIDGMGEVEGMGYGTDQSVVNIRLPEPLEEGKEYLFTWSGLYDSDGKPIAEQTWAILNEKEEEEEDPPSTAAPGQVLINEVMANPKGLTTFPETEYIELLNTSGATVPLKGWSFLYDGKPMLLPEDLSLPPQGYAVLYRAGRDILVDKPAQAIALTNFPAALANTGKALALQDATGEQIDAFTYPAATPAISWERSAEGCHLSTNTRGGTPGSLNSIPEEIEEPGENEDTEEPGEPELEAPVAGARDIVFNELLPNPFSGGSEYVELYNRSGRSLSVAGLAIATRKTDGAFSSYYSLADISAAVEDGGYIVLTKDKAAVASFYLLIAPEVVYELKLPVLANTSSTLVLFNTKNGNIIDEVSYSSKWHHPAVKDEKGVALERIDPEGETQDAANWTSASSLSGYGTPGYQNSQSGKEDTPGITAIAAPVLSEDGLYHIKYQLERPGYNCRAYIFDMSGYRVAEIANNELPGSSGELVWDGKSSKGKRLQTGIYIFFVELYHASGKTQQYKKVFLIR